MRSWAIGTACAFVIILVSVDDAQAFRSRNGLEVNPISDTVFEVVDNGRTFGPGYWCAAADYARRALRMPWLATLYVHRGLGWAETANRRPSVQFSSEGSGKGIVSLGVPSTGDAMSVQRANTMCLNWEPLN